MSCTSSGKASKIKCFPFFRIAFEKSKAKTVIRAEPEGGTKTLKGKGVFPPMYEKPDFIQLPTYLQNDALAKGTAYTGDDISDTDLEDGTGIDFDKIEWGSFKKAFYNRQKKYKHLKSLGAYAKYIMDHPDDFNKHTKKRANFYLNILKVLGGSGERTQTLPPKITQ